MPRFGTPGLRVFEASSRRWARQREKVPGAGGAGQSVLSWYCDRNTWERKFCGAGLGEVRTCGTCVAKLGGFACGHGTARAGVCRRNALRFLPGNFFRDALGLSVGFCSDGCGSSFISISTGTGSVTRLATTGPAGPTGIFPPTNAFVRSPKPSTESQPARLAPARMVSNTTRTHTRI